MGHTYWGRICGFASSDGETMRALLTIAAISCMPVLDASGYAAKLEQCNRESRSLCESIVCENRVRLAAGREERRIPSHCSGQHE